MLKPILFMSFFCLCLVNGIDYDGSVNLKVLHSLNCKNERFCHRGNISVKSLKSGVAIIEQVPLSEDHINELKEIAQSGGFYFIKTILSFADVKEMEFLSSMKAQMYLDNNLSDVINMWVLPNGAVIAVNFQVSNYSASMYDELDTHEIKSTFFVRQVDQAPVPDTASYIQKLEREREAREKGEVKDNRSFLAKYWMYIVPIAIFVMVSGAANTDPPQGR